MKFKIGDKVNVLETGCTGVVKQSKASVSYGNEYRILRDHGPYHLMWYIEAHLELAKEEI